MSRRLAVAVLIACVTPLPACLDQAPSLHALIPEAEAVAVPIEGTWVDKDDLGMTFEPAGRGYALELRGKDCQDGDCVLRLDVRFGRIGDQLFADFIGHDADDEFGTWPVHAFARVSLDKDRLEFAVLHRDWVLAKVKAKPSSIAHEIADDKVVLTAKTAALRKAMKEWMGDPQAFGNPLVFNRRAAVAPVAAR